MEIKRKMSLSKINTLPSIVILTVRYIGLWRGDKRNNKHVLARFAIFCFLSIYVSQFIALIMSKDDTARLFECFSVISFCGMGILKLFCLSRKRERWLNLLDLMSRLEKDQLKHEEDFADYQSDDEDDSDRVAVLIRNYTEQFKRTSTILFRIYCFTGVIFILSPFLEYAFWTFRGQRPDGYPHILPSWNPFDSVHFACYAITIIFEAVAAIYCVCVHVAFDSTVIGAMIFLCGQFSSLVYQSEMIGGKGKICRLSNRRDARAHFRIIKCHGVHIQLVSSIVELDMLLRNILGVYFFLATLTLCSVAVRLKSEQMSMMQLVSLLQYMCATLTQLYIYCRYGDAVYNKSAIGAAQGPFTAAIWCLGPRIRREIAMLGFGMMRPRRLHAGPFNTVDLPSFIQIVRAAYSYYAVLGKSNEN